MNFLYAPFHQPTGFINLDHLAVYKRTRIAIAATASTICFISNIYFHTMNRGVYDNSDT